MHVTDNGKKHRNIHEQKSFSWELAVVSELKVIFKCRYQHYNGEDCVKAGLKNIILAVKKLRKLSKDKERNLLKKMKKTVKT